MNKYEVVIGLEIHAELRTRTKIFCGCSTEFGGEPNSHCCPVCLGLPGVLPVLNQKAVEFAIMAGLALNCEIAEYSKFDRKNYFYPDLTKAYQVSQFDLPICGRGQVGFDLDGTKYVAGITRVHLEEEAGKSVHSGDNILGSDYSSLDYNRAGIPLIEIVTEPDLRSPAEAKAFLEQLKLTLQYIAVSDCKMQEGSLRCDANVSLRPLHQEELGTKVEIKNLNSFRALERALEYEVARQTEYLDQSKVIVQETRAWDDVRGVTVSMRSKEESHDYRYFPEPDLVPLQVDPNWVGSLASGLPELPLAKKERLQKQFGLSDYEAGFLVSSLEDSQFFEKTVAIYPNPKVVCNWVMGEYTRLRNTTEEEEQLGHLTPEMLAELLSMVEKGAVSGTLAKDVLTEMYLHGKTASAIVEAKGLSQISDLSTLTELVERVLQEHPALVDRFRSGEEKLLGFFVGQIMKETRGKANPGLVNTLLQEKLH